MKFQFILKDFADSPLISGGIYQIIWLVELLQKNNIPAHIVSSHLNPKYKASDILFAPYANDAISIVPEVVYNKYYGHRCTIPFFQGFAIGTELNYSINPSLTISPYIRGLIEAKGHECFYIPSFIKEKDILNTNFAKDRNLCIKLNECKKPFVVNEKIGRAHV